MKLKASLQMSKFKTSKKEIEKEIRRTIKRNIYRTYDYTRKRNIDAFHLSETLYRKNNKVWKRVEKERKNSFRGRYNKIHHHSR